MPLSRLIAQAELPQTIEFKASLGFLWQNTPAPAKNFFSLSPVVSEARISTMEVVEGALSLPLGKGFGMELMIAGTPVSSFEFKKVFYSPRVHYETLGIYYDILCGGKHRLRTEVLGGSYFVTQHCDANATLGYIPTAVVPVADRFFTVGQNLWGAGCSVELVGLHGRHLSTTLKAAYRYLFSPETIVYELNETIDAFPAMTQHSVAFTVGLVYLL